MKVEEIKITDIVPADYNPRLISEEDFQHLKTSIEEFGLVDPIIINLENNRIIGGHQRYDVLLEKYLDKGEFENLKLLKLNKIGWVFADDNLKIKSEDYEKALNLALNKISGDWDNPKLDKVLADIDENIFDINLIGFNDVERTHIALETKEQSSKYGTKDKYMAVADNVRFRIGKYEFLIPLEEYNVWKENLMLESQKKQLSVTEILLDRLNLSSLLKNSKNSGKEGV